MVRGMLALSENLDARAFNRRRDQRIFNEAITYRGGREQMTGAWKDDLALLVATDIVASVPPY